VESLSLFLKGVQVRTLIVEFRRTDLSIEFIEGLISQDSSKATSGRNQKKNER